MRAITLHLKILISLLFIAGITSIAYQVFVLKIPLTEQETGQVWTIDAKVNFTVRGNKPIQVDLRVPAAENASKYTRIDQDSVLANGYGNSRTTDNAGNQVVTLSVRRATGLQTLYYRVTITEDDNTFVPISEKGRSYRKAIEMDEPGKVAADTLLAYIRERSSDTTTFITTAIQVMNMPDNDHVRALLGADQTPKNRARVLEVLLSQAHIPIQNVHTLRLIKGSNQTPELWVRSYVETTKSDASGKESKTGRWIYFDAQKGERGLPKDRIVWWVGDEELLTVTNGQQAQVTFSVDNRELTAKGIIYNKLSDKGASNFLTYSLYSLPIQVQDTYLTMLVIPFGVLVILLLRNIVGVQTLGTFTPVLIALAFRETGLIFGVSLFTIIVALGLSVRSYLEHLKLQMLPRLSVVLTFVVIAIASISLFSHKLGLDQGLAVTLFPMVILTMTIERLSITWEERGGGFAFKVAIGTLITASVAHYLMNVPALAYFVFTFPGILLILISFMLAMGRYRGYRLTELRRFKALLKEG